MTKFKEALYYEKLENGKVKCFLCPHSCTIDDGRVGICRVRENKGGILYTLNYKEITSYAYDPIEKKPLYHFYPGSKIFSIGTFGCNLSCAYCQNWEIAHVRPTTVEISDEDILKLSKANGSIGIAYTYNEPSIWYEYVLSMSKKIKKKGLKNVYITNGYIQKEPLKELLPYIDAMNIDLKAIDDKFYQEICGGRISPVLGNIELASKETHVEVTTLVVEGKNDFPEDIERIAKFLSSIDKNIPLHLNRYHPAFKLNLPPTSFDSLKKCLDIARKYLNYVYVGNVWGFDINTYCPQCNNKLVSRNYDVNIMGIQNGNCSKCGYPIKIVY